jgi:hypothetical protein
MASAAASTAPKATPAALARLLGVSRQAVADLIKRQIIPIDSAGLIDVDLARHAITNRVRPSGKAATAAAGGQVEAPHAAATPPLDQAREQANNSATSDATTSYHVAKTLREVAEARIAQLKLAEMRGDLIRADEVRSTQARLVSGLREALLQIPARLAPVVAAESDQAACHDLLQKELHLVMAQLVAT